MKKVLIVLALGFSLAHAGVGLEPSLFFDQQVPVISATTPGGEVALIGVGREQNGFVTFVHRVAGLLTARSGISLAGDGTLAFPGRTLDLMLVRAGDGAWLRTVVDGGPFDVDRTRARLTRRDDSV